MSSYHKVKNILSWKHKSDVETISPEAEESAESEEIDVVDFTVEVRTCFVYNEFCFSLCSLWAVIFKAKFDLYVLKFIFVLI